MKLLRKYQQRKKLTCRDQEYQFWSRLRIDIDLDQYHLFFVQISKSKEKKFNKSFFFIQMALGVNPGESRRVTFHKRKSRSTKARASSGQRPRSPTPFRAWHRAAHPRGSSTRKSGPSTRIGLRRDPTTSQVSVPPK